MVKSMRPEDTVIGANVRRIRKLRGQSQEWLGSRLNLTFQQVQKYEKGTNRIGGSRLTQIASILQVPVTALFEGIDQSGKVEDLPQMKFFEIVGATTLVDAVIGAEFESERIKLVRACNAVVKALRTE